MFKKFFSSTAFPIIFILVGLFFILLAVWVEFENPLWKQTWDTLGKTMFVSGAFAGLLKLMQIHGVFKQELERLIFEPKFLTNRKDIPLYWEKLSQELFKNKFPNIRTKMLADIKDTYMPTKEMVYYDKAEHFIEIDLDADGNMTAKKTTTLNIVCTDGKKTEATYEFAATFRDKKDAQNEHSYSDLSIKINGEDAKFIAVDNGKQIGEETIYKGKVILHGCDEYELERQDRIKCKLEDDDIITFRATKLTNTLTVTISHSSNVDIIFMKMGTLDKFMPKQSQSTATLKKFEYKGIIYKEQGYMIKVIKR